VIVWKVRTCHDSAVFSQYPGESSSAQDLISELLQLFFPSYKLSTAVRYEIQAVLPEEQAVIDKIQVYFSVANLVAVT
jgi:hypothetical protein